MKKTIKKLTCGVLAAISVFGCAATLTACETSHPEVEMKIEFNDKTYTLEYKLYRKISPRTVNHFLWLAGNGYYDGRCVHDYLESERMHTGGYTASTTDATEIVYKQYFNEIQTFDNYAKFPHSVWKNESKADALYTLKGEFEENDYVVTNGALKETFGSLTMYYHNLPEAMDADVYAALAFSDDKPNVGKYRYNHATSLFYISLSTTTKTNNNYCTFATLEKGSDELKDLQEAINDYIEANFGEEDKDDFTETVMKNIMEGDKMFENSSSEKAFKVPTKPIVIKKVKVTKY